MGKPRKATSCPLCGCFARSYRRLAPFLKCSACQLHFRSAAPASDELSGWYDKAWRDPANNVVETGGTFRNLAITYRSKLVESLGRTDLSGLKILDFGAGRGELMRALKFAGAAVCGVDPFGYRYLRERGYDAYPSLEALPEGLRFDGVVTIDVIEHLVAPWEDMRSLRSRIAEGGWLYVATPNATSAAAVVLGKQWPEFQKLGHVNLFTSRSLQGVLSEAGFKDIRRLSWRVSYEGSPARCALRQVLQIVGWDGQLRYLASASGNSVSPNSTVTSNREIWSRTESESCGVSPG